MATQYPIPPESEQAFSIKIIYEDEYLLALNKPAGLPMHANLDTQRLHLIKLLEEYLLKRDGQAGYIGIHQRLDLGTSGLVIFARCQEANPSLAEQFASHSLRKIYLALCKGTPKQERWENCRALGEPLCRGGAVSWEERAPRSGSFRAVPPHFKEARTTFEVVQRLEGYTLVQAQLHTGRKHQIRAHLASANLPIVGDSLYGGPKGIAGRACGHPLLHSYQLDLIHPHSGEPLHLCAPLPADFKKIIQKLKKNTPPPPGQ